MLHKGYTLWRENYYNTAALAKFLILCNTQRDNRQSKHEGSAQETARNRDAEMQGDSIAQRIILLLVIV
jgi:hypothetical protein